jgi:8-oxo-dGTP diphosphatase
MKKYDFEGRRDSDGDEIPVRRIESPTGRYVEVSEMTKTLDRPKVGISILVFQPFTRNILMGIRLGSHGKNTWSIPGGHLEYGEAWLRCAVRELTEETGMALAGGTFAGVTNHVLEKEHLHYVDIVIAGWGIGEPVVMEPDKCAGWEWVQTDYVMDRQPMFQILEEKLQTLDLNNIRLLLPVM